MATCGKISPTSVLHEIFRIFSSLVDLIFSPLKQTPRIRKILTVGTANASPAFVPLQSLAIPS